MPLLGELAVPARGVVERGTRRQAEHGIRIHPGIEAGGRPCPRARPRMWARARSILAAMAATPNPEGIPQRLAAIRAQMSLLADYL
jgi:hypothetical protein